MIEINSLKTLEYDKILQRVSAFAHSQPTKEFILNILPSTDVEDVKYQLDLTEQADIILHELTISPSIYFDDMSDILQALDKRATLSIEDILKVAKLLHSSSSIIKNFALANDDRLIDIKDIASVLYQDKALEDNIKSSFLSSNEVSDNASHSLKEIRRSIRLVNDKIVQKLGSYLTGNNSKYLQDSIITVRNDRYVLPVKAEYKSHIDGLVHDQSATKSTIYIEPIAIVNLNNELKSLMLDENKEIENILRTFSQDIADILLPLTQTYDTCILLDSIFAKAKYARSIKAIRPNLSANGYINLKLGRHPLILPTKVVPVSIEIGKDFDTMVITGPNTGGKTVLLKLVGLTCLMGMTGLFVPCQEDSTIAVFDNIFCDIGDNQSIEDNLSTFSSHIVNIIEITNKATHNCLCLLDELGGGTNPVEGSALAVSIIEFLRAKKCIIMTSSHYNELKEYAYATNGVSVASMDFDPVTLMPTYQLLIGISGSSKALEIAQSLGLDMSIVNNAKSKFDDEKISFDRVIASAEKSRRDAEKLKEEIALTHNQIQLLKDENIKLNQTLVQKQQKLDEKLAKNSKELLRDYIDEADELIEEIKDLVKSGDEKALFEARKIKKKLEDKLYVEESESEYEKIAGDINVGDSIYVSSLKTTACVTSINPKKKELTIKAGIITTNIKLKDAIKIKLKDTKKTIVVPKTKRVLHNDDVKQEINLIGQRAEEAIFNLEKYLNDAIMHGYSEVRIVHGKGSGILRKAVSEYLKTCPCISTFRLGNYGEGDVGVTIATFKE